MQINRQLWSAATFIHGPHGPEKRKGCLMKKLSNLALIGAVFSFGVATTSVPRALPFAGVVSVLKSTSEDAGIIEQVHACNRTCQRGPVEEWGGAVRWHRHVGKACRPISCSR